ncbi:MAG TPA: hypothetical protein PKZ52_01855, partial [Cellvibrionaceae bacterium]|nr:hypothetical protein [Cellvibrionaceae bacterium]
ALTLAKMRGFSCFSAARGESHLYRGIHADIINPALNAAGLIIIFSKAVTLIRQRAKPQYLPAFITCAQQPVKISCH